MSPEEAVEAGALALFGEKYGEEVRVVSMGGADPEKGEGRAYSTELCGGTHVRRSGDIGFLKVVSEGALAAGVRRVEAVAGAAALAHVERQEHLLAAAATALKTAPAELPARLAGLLDERKRLERELADMRKRLAAGGGDGAAKASETREVAGVKFDARLLEGVLPRDLKPMADELKTRVGSGVVALVAVNDGKASLVVGVTDDLTGRVSAVDLVRAGSAALGGKGGGGRPDMAQAGGPDGTAAQAALTAIEGALEATV
jgi:alanyl-tRNA synthetase